MGDLEDEMERAAPLLRDFHDAWFTAMATYNEYDAKHRAEHDDTTAANCVRSHFIPELVRRFDGKASCELRGVNRLKLLIYRDLQVWRFKKVDAHGRHRNVVITQQEDFDDEYPIEGLPLPSEATRLTSGYVLDEAGDIERIIVARILGRDVLWTAQTTLINDEMKVEDITPLRISGTERVDFNAERARARRGRR